MNDPVSVLFVPRTKNGELITKLREVENKMAEITGDRFKLVERAGRMVKVRLPALTHGLVRTAAEMTAGYARVETRAMEIASEGV